MESLKYKNKDYDHKKQWNCVAEAFAFGGCLSSDLDQPMSKKPRFKSINFMDPHSTQYTSICGPCVEREPKTWTVRVEEKHEHDLIFQLAPGGIPICTLNEPNCVLFPRSRRKGSMDFDNDDDNLPECDG